MKKSILLWTKTTYVATFILFLLCLTFSCQQQVEEGITEEEAKALADKSIEVWNGGNLSLFDEILSPEYVCHYVDISEDIIGIEANKENVTSYRITYPDFNVTIDELIIKGDNIVLRWTSTGTNTGSSTGPWGDLPPTGKKFKISGVVISHVVDGKMIESWYFYNYAAALIQLGFTITPPTIEGEE